jgi:hypothetical protein
MDEAKSKMPRTTQNLRIEGTTSSSGCLREATDFLDFSYSTSYSQMMAPVTGTQNNSNY